MTTAREILVAGLKAIGADGFVNDELDCACGLNDCRFLWCDTFPLDECLPAKFVPVTNHKPGDQLPKGYYVPLWQEPQP